MEQMCLKEVNGTEPVMAMSVSSSCFFCGNQTGSEAEGSKKLVSLKLFCRYLKLNLTENGAGSEEPGSDSFLLCSKCAGLQNALSNLILTAEVIQMKINYRLEELKRVLEAADHNNDRRSSRKAFLQKCRLKTGCVSPRVELEKLEVPLLDFPLKPEPEVPDSDIVEQECAGDDGGDRNSTCASELESINTKTEPSGLDSAQSSLPGPACPILDEASLPEVERVVEVQQEVKEEHTKSETSSQCETFGSGSGKHVGAPWSALDSGQSSLPGPDCPASTSSIEVTQPEGGSSCLIPALPPGVLLVSNPFPLQHTLKTKILVRDEQGQEKIHELEELLLRNGTTEFRCPFPECGKVFAKLNCLQTHVSRLHYGVRSECHKCHKRFSTNDSLKRHKLLKICEAETNPVLKPFQCTVCGRRCATERALYDHNRQTHLFKFNCEVCQKSFSSKCNLNKHVKNVHEKRQANCKQKRHECEEPGCGKRFLTRTSLRLHKALKHSPEAV